MHNQRWHRVIPWPEPDAEVDVGLYTLGALQQRSRVLPLNRRDEDPSESSAYYEDFSVRLGLCCSLCTRRSTVVAHAAEDLAGCFCMHRRWGGGEGDTVQERARQPGFVVGHGGQRVWREADQLDTTVRQRCNRRFDVWEQRRSKDARHSVVEYRRMGRYSYVKPLGNLRERGVDDARERYRHCGAVVIDESLAFQVEVCELGGGSPAAAH